MSPLGPANSGSDPNPTATLQFERAEFSGGHSGPACSTCKRPADNEYHHLNGRVFCTSCRAKIEQSIEKLRQSGSLARAALFGLGAAIVGALIFYGVSAATGYQFGLIAVVVGVLVGKAVRKGSGSIGGRKYQALAMVLTYFSIASTYVPPLTKAFYARGREARRPPKLRRSLRRRPERRLPAPRSISAWCRSTPSCLCWRWPPRFSAASAIFWALSSSASGFGRRGNSTAESM